jgi:hypothetical protein
MTRQKGIRLAVVALALTLSAALVACGDEEERSYNDKQIVERLDLKQTSDQGRKVYAIGGDLFCEVESNLLNDSGEVDKAEDKDKVGLVISSSEGNVGVVAVPVFLPDCEQKVKKVLNRLDPRPKE